MPESAFMLFIYSYICCRLICRAMRARHYSRCFELYAYDERHDAAPASPLFCEPFMPSDAPDKIFFFFTP